MSASNSKVVLITGASRDIGTARLLAARDAAEALGGARVMYRIGLLRGQFKTTARYA